MRFTSIEKSAHYREHHERGFPWPDVIEAILTGKLRKKRGAYELKDGKRYILCRLRGTALVVINA